MEFVNVAEVDLIQLLLCLHIVVLVLLHGRIYDLVQRVRLKQLECAAGVGGDGELARRHEWEPAGAHDDGNLLAYIALRDGVFAMRLVVAEIPAGIAELMCLPREIDLSTPPARLDPELCEVPTHVPSLMPEQCLLGTCFVRGAGYSV